MHPQLAQLVELGSWPRVCGWCGSPHERDPRPIRKVPEAHLHVTVGGTTDAGLGIAADHGRRR